MGAVDDDAAPVTGADKTTPGVSETRACVGRARERSVDTFRKGVLPRPDKTERAKSALIPLLQVGEVRCKRFGAFEVHDGGNPTRDEIRRVARDRQAEALERRGKLVRDSAGLVDRNFIAERERIRRLGIGLALRARG